MSLSKNERRTIRRAARHIREHADMLQQSEQDGNGWVDSRSAWKSIKADRKLAKRLQAVAGAK